MHQRLTIISYILPCTITCITSGNLCDKFGTKMVGLTSAIIAIPTFIWIGVPDKRLPFWSIIPAVIVAGITMASILVSLVTDISKAVHEQKSIDNQKQNGYKRAFALMSSFYAVGIFSGSFLSSLKVFVGYFWLCFTMAMMFVSCIPLIYYYIGHDKNIYPRSSPAPSIASDNTAVESSFVSENVTVETKSVIVVP